MHHAKFELLKKGITLTNDRHITMSVKNLRAIIKFTLATNIT